MKHHHIHPADQIIKKISEATLNEPTGSDDQVIKNWGEDADNGDEAAMDELRAVARTNGIDPEEYSSGSELAAAILFGGGEHAREVQGFMDKDSAEDEVQGFMDIDGDEGTGDPEQAMEDHLADILAEAGWKCESFASAGVMTRNKGLVVRNEFGKFQIDIKRDNR